MREQRGWSERGAGILSAARLPCGCEGVKGVDVSTPGKYDNQSQRNTQGHGGGASADLPQLFCSHKLSGVFSWAVSRCVSTVSPWWQLKHTRVRIWWCPHNTRTSRSIKMGLRPPLHPPWLDSAARKWARARSTPSQCSLCWTNWSTCWIRYRRTRTRWRWARGGATAGAQGGWDGSFQQAAFTPWK